MASQRIPFLAAVLTLIIGGGLAIVAFVHAQTGTTVAKTFAGSATFQYGDAGGTIENNVTIHQKVIYLKNTGSDPDTFRTMLPVNPESRCGLRSSGQDQPNTLPNLLPTTLDVPLAVNNATIYINVVCVTQGLPVGPFIWSYKTVSVGALDAGSEKVIADVQDTVQVTETIPCSDSDGGIATGVKGIATGTYAGAITSYISIYGQEPNPTSPKTTTDRFSTYIDHCATSTQLNEGFCKDDGRIGALGTNCPYGCKDGVCVTQASSSSSSGCITDADCGSTYIDENGGTVCGPEKASVYTVVQKYRYFPYCSSGKCYNKVKFDKVTVQECAAGTICIHFSKDNQAAAACNTPLAACPTNAPLPPSLCMCGGTLVGDYAEYNGSGSCCTDGNGKFWTLFGQCPSPAPTSPRTASQAIIVPTPSPSVTAPSVTTPTPSPTIPSVTSVSSAAPSVLRPASPLNLPKVQTGSTVQKVQTVPVVQKILRKLSPKEFKKEQVTFRQELRKFERVLLRKKDTAALDQIADLREELYDLDHDDPSAGEDLQMLQEEFAELRLIVEAPPSSPATLPKQVVKQETPMSPLFSQTTSITLTYPTEGSTVTGIVPIDIDAQNAPGIAGIQFQIDGVNVGGDPDGKLPYSRPWSAGRATNGTHVLRAVAFDERGNTVSSNEVRVTVRNVPDFIRPTISDLRVLAVTRTTATIHWTTSEPVGTSISYHPYGRINEDGSIRDYQEKRVEHTVTLRGLQPGTTYNYIVTAQDDALNSTESRPPYGFMTLAKSPIAILNVKVKDITRTSATIAWTTTVPADSLVQILDWGILPVRDDNLVTEHEVKLTGLYPHASHRFRVISQDRAGNTVRYPLPDMYKDRASFSTKEVFDEKTQVTIHAFRGEQWDPYRFVPFYPGTEAYFTVQVTDDTPLHTVRVTFRSSKMGSKPLWEVLLPQCNGQMSCEETKHPFIVPGEPGEYSIYVTVEDGSGYQRDTGGSGKDYVKVVPCPGGSGKC